MQELMEILNELHPDVDFTKEKALVDGRILDSFDIVTLVAEIGDTFDVQISAVDMVPENFNSVEAIWEVIESKLEDE